MYEHVIDTATLGWKPLDFAGVSMCVVYEESASGGLTVLTRLEAGARIPAHRHRQAAERVFVLSGDFVEAGVVHGPGSFFVGAAGSSHGPHESRGGCTVLSMFSAALDFELV